LIKKDGQLVTRYHNFATAQLFLRPRNIRVGTKWYDNTYSALFQSRSAGHSKAPVRSWWNPWSVFTLRTSGEFNCCPGGAIQSRTAPFKLLVSSDLAPEAPFWIYTYGSNLKVPLHVKTKEAHQLSDTSDFLVGAFNHMILKARYHAYKKIERSVFSSLPANAW
jgi:hypothetical protein